MILRFHGAFYYLIALDRRKLLTASYFQTKLSRLRPNSLKDVIAELSAFEVVVGKATLGQAWQTGRH